MRVGVDGRELSAGVRTGIARYLVEVLRAASSAGCECLVYVEPGTRTEPVDRLPGVTARPIPTCWTPWWDQVLLPRRLGRDGVAVFLSPYYKAPLVASCPVVITIHDLYFIGYPGRRRPVYDAVVSRLATLYARRAAAVIADSDWSRRALVQRLGVEGTKVRTIPVTLAAAFAPRPLSEVVRGRYAIEGSYILFVGNFLPHKNLPRLVRAYATLPAPLRDRHRLVLAGADLAHRPPLERLVAETGLADRVVFPGPIDDDDLPPLYSGASLFVLPSLVEGFGLPALEAMACGAPVVTSNRGALPEVVADAALTVDPESETALAAAMERVLREPDLGERLSRRGLERARDFGLERTAGRVVDLLREVSAGWRGPSRRAPGPR
ncbi:MAG: glycosyltransferase family 4 protein [Candidatus Rokubacteria bacterium]|nr:glycosyltransferase family 4 protein [Candidatus Rokubacteria bacterium]